MSTVAYDDALRQWAIDQLRTHGHEPERDYDPSSIKVRFGGYGGDVGTDATPEPYATLDVFISADTFGVTWEAEYDIGSNANVETFELARNPHEHARCPTALRQP